MYFILQKMNNSKLIKKKCKVIKILLTDVDGVLTDGSMYYTESGERMKKFNARDGMGVELPVSYTHLTLPTILLV